MSQIQVEALYSLCSYLPESADELEKMNKLKALELKQMVKPVPELLDEVNKILKS